MFYDRHNVSRETFHRLGAEYDFAEMHVPAKGRAGQAGGGATTPAVCIPRNGHLMKLRGTTTAPEPPTGNRRGIVTGFSYQSRMRLMEYVAGLDRTCDPSHWLFITLTYPKRYPNDPRTWKHHLRLFTQRLARDFPNIAALWKMEYQRRGAPHFHLLCYGAEYLDYNYVACCWYDCVGSGDVLHLLAGTRVERPRTWNGVACYASKYLAKVEPPQPGQGCGRIWGVYNRKNMPRQEQSYGLDWSGFHALRRRMARFAQGAKPVEWATLSQNQTPRYVPSRTKAVQGCKLFINEAVALQLARGLVLDVEKDPCLAPNQAQNGVSPLTRLGMPLGGINGSGATTGGPGLHRTGVDNATIQKGNQRGSAKSKRQAEAPELRAWSATTFPKYLRHVPGPGEAGRIHDRDCYGFLQRLFGDGV